jgi:hypothetical protein
MSRQAGADMLFFRLLTHAGHLFHWFLQALWHENALSSIGMAVLEVISDCPTTQQFPGTAVPGKLVLYAWTLMAAGTAALAV